MSWSRRKPKWDWKAFLTEDEASEVRDSERQIEHARHIIATFQPGLALIQNRAIHRAKYHAAMGGQGSGKNG